MPKFLKLGKFTYIINICKKKLVFKDIYVNSSYLKILTIKILIYIICIILKKYLKYKNKYLNGGNRGICDKKSSIDEKKIKKVLDKKVTLDKSIITKNDYYFTDIEEIIITNNVVFEIKPEAFSNCLNLIYVDMINAFNLKK